MYDLFGKDCPLNALPKKQMYRRALDLVMERHNAGDIDEWFKGVNHNWPFGFAVFYHHSHRDHLIRHGIEVTRRYLQDIQDGMVDERLLPFGVIPMLAAGKGDSLGVKIENGKVIVSSLDVAKVFDKQHLHVLRDVKSLDCSEEFRLSNFGLSSYKNGQNKSQPCYNLTRDGFAFLCMGYTGKKAAAFKEAYIKRFNEMEAALQGKPRLAALPGGAIK